MASEPCYVLSGPPAKQMISIRAPPPLPFKLLQEPITWVGPSFSYFHISNLPRLNEYQTKYCAFVVALQMHNLTALSQARSTRKITQFLSRDNKIHEKITQF